VRPETNQPRRPRNSTGRNAGPRRSGDEAKGRRLDHGVGTASPLGNSYPASADNLLAGKSGVRAVTDFDVS
jgi:hypothetical protein